MNKARNFEGIREGINQHPGCLGAMSSITKRRQLDPPPESEDYSDDGEYSEDYEDESEDEAPRSSNKKKKKHNPFIDVEAEVDEDEEDENEEDEEYQSLKRDFIANDEEEEAAMLANASNYLRSTSTSRAQQQRATPEDLQAEEQRLRSLYGAQRFYDESAGASSAEPQQALLPTLADPKLWLVRCKAGRESAIVCALLQKAMKLAKSQAPLLITGAVAREHLKGFFYVEARNMAHVTHAINGVANVYALNISLVPIAEMVQVLWPTPKSLTDAPTVDSWVRVKRGKYAGDLALVIQVIDVGELFRLRLVPRLSVYAQSTTDQAEAKAPARLFNPQEVAKLDREHSITKSRGHWVYLGETYRDGFLEKDFRLTSLVVRSVKPTVEELALFQRDQSATTQSTVAAKATTTAIFGVGDLVRVIEGEFRNLLGTITSVQASSEMLTVKFQEHTASATLSFRSCQKHLRCGDHVHVEQGEHRGESGLVVNIDDRFATLFSDLSMREISVFLSDVTSNGASNNSVPLPAAMVTANVLDLCQVSLGVYAVIIRVDSNGSIHARDQSNQMRVLRSGQFTLKPFAGKSTTFDLNGRPLSCGDHVTLQGGEGRYSVLYICGSSGDVFCKAINEDNASSVFATKGRNLKVAGGVPNAGGAPVRLQKADSAFVNRSVMITGGQWKGYVGIVVAIVGANARVELHTANRIVSVDKTRLKLAGSTMQPFSVGGSWGAGGVSSGAHQLHERTPAWQGGATGGKTPSWEGGKTPQWGGGKTPTWEGGKTPTHSANPWTDGGKTPSWGDAGGKTPKRENGLSGWDEPVPASSIFSKSKAATTSKEGWDSETPARKPAPAASEPSASAVRNERSEESQQLVWGSTRRQPQEVRSFHAAVPNERSAEAVQKLPAWLQPGTVARVTQAINQDKIVVVRSISNGTGKTAVQCVFVNSSGSGVSSGPSKDDDDDEAFFPVDSLQPVVPSKKDFVCVVSGPEGEDIGTCGTLISVVNEEALVKVENSEDLKMFPIDALVKKERASK